MSDSGSRRAAAAATLLVVIWVATYWLWKPGEGGTLSFGEAPAAAEILRPLDAVVDPLNGESASQEVDPVPVSGGEPEAVSPGEAPVASGEAPRLIPPEFTEYTVRRGDDIMSIAGRLYGTTRHWQAIGKANPEVDPRKLRAGQVLLIPKDPSNIQGVVVNAEEPADEVTPGVSDEGVEYVVLKNDSLWKIAKSVYGDGTKWPVIRDANRALVGDEGEKLRPGMTLRVPLAPRPAR